MMPGNMASTKLNATEDARVVSAPFFNPSMKNLITSYRGIL